MDSYPGLDHELRALAIGNAGATVWFTSGARLRRSGLPAAVERALVVRGINAYLLDARRILDRLCGPGTSRDADRPDPIRAVATVAELLADAGLVALVAEWCPDRVRRDAARRAHRGRRLRFLEVLVEQPVADEQFQDPHVPEISVRVGDGPRALHAEQIVAAVIERISPRSNATTPR